MDVIKGVTHTPQGYRVTQGTIPSGATVRVQGHPLESRSDVGKTGTFLGYSIPHGFAIVDCGGKENLFHPEALKIED